MKNLLGVLMIVFCMSTLAHANCANGVCGLTNRVANVARSVVSVPVNVVERTVENKTVRKVVSAPVKVLRNRTRCCGCR